MAFTEKDRTALAAARRTVEQLSVREQTAIVFAADVCRRAGLVISSGCTWHDVIRSAAEIRDALEPFDSGMRLGTYADA